MSARTIILLVVAVALAVGVAVKKKTPPPKPAGGTAAALDEGLTPEEIKEIETARRNQVPLPLRDLAGTEPEIPPELDIKVEVDAASGKNRLVFYITEAHGYYVETFDIDFWYKNSPTVTGPENAPLRVNHPLENKYLKANETLKDCVEVVPAELKRVGGSIGTTENWEARIRKHGRARTKNPDPLPELPEMTTCR